MAGQLTYLGILAAQTAKGRRAVAVALAGAVEMYHLVDAGIKADDPTVVSWLLAAGISPEEASSAIPPEDLVSEVVLPEIGSRTLVVSHSDLDIEFVSILVASLVKRANPPIITNIELTGPVARDVNGAAGRRAYALQAHYEAILEASRTSPAVHVLDGRIDGRGRLTQLSVDGPFAKQNWTLEEDGDGLLAMSSLTSLAPLASFEIAHTRAAAAIRLLAGKTGIVEKMAA